MARLWLARQGVAGNDRPTKGPRDTRYPAVTNSSRRDPNLNASASHATEQEKSAQQAPTIPGISHSPFS